MGGPPTPTSLSRLVSGRRLVDPQTGNPTPEFISNLNNMIANIQSQVSGLQGVVNSVENALDQAGIAVRQADSANNTTAALSQGSYLATSYVSPTSIITSVVNTGTPTTADITIANHNRVYGDGSSVAVTGATLTGLALSTTYWIYYVDTARSGGAVSFQTTTTNTVAVQHGDTHCVGRVTTPASGSTTVVQGGGTVGPGILWEPSDFGS